MSAKISILNALILFLTCFLIPAQNFAFAKENKNSRNIFFVGDVLLSRLIEEEFREKNTVDLDFTMREMFSSASLVVGNLEGSIGRTDDCPDDAPANLCFNISPSRVEFLSRNGFDAMVMENNHSMDTGINGKKLTRETLASRNIFPLEYENAPMFIKIDYLTIGIIPFSMAPDASGNFVRIPSELFLRKLKKAKSLSDLVVVYVHWGKELQDWASTEMIEDADWLTRNGADLIIGSHPHVIIEPECVNGKPVFFSLGNFLFDQKYSQTREGLVVKCDISIEEKRFQCASLFTRREENSFFPVLAEKSSFGEIPLRDCSSHLRQTITLHGINLRARSMPDDDIGSIILEGWREGKLLWETSPANVITVQTGQFNQGESEFLFTLEKHYSDIDKEYAPRPYVYRVTENGLVAKWRGSALAWPIKDATVLCDDECYLCVLHRGDSFLIPDPKTDKTRVVLYKWNGFGFSGINENEILMNKCKEYYDDHE